MTNPDLARNPDGTVTMPESKDSWQAMMLRIHRNLEVMRKESIANCPDEDVDD